VRQLLLVAALWIIHAVPASAQDLLKSIRSTTKVEFENEQVRVLRIKYGPGEKSVMHEHPANVAVFMTDGQVKFTLPDGKSQLASAKGGRHSGPLRESTCPKMWATSHSRSSWSS
jgi:hypothetical protein